MSDTNISKIIGTDEDSGLQRRIDITQVCINIKAKVIDIAYEINLVSKSGKVIKTEKEGGYFRKNTPVQMGIRQKEGEAPGVTEEYEASPASNKYDQLAESAIGLAIKEMLMADLEKYPEL